METIKDKNDESNQEEHGDGNDEKIYYISNDCVELVG